MVDQEIEDDGKGKKDPKENDSEEPPAKAATAAGVDESVATLPELTKPESSVTTNHGQNKTNVGVTTREDTIVVHSDNKEGNEENGVIADEFDQFDKNGGEDILIKTAGTDVATGGGGGIGAAGTEKEGTGENIDMVEQESGEKVIDEGKLSGTPDIVKRLYDSMFENNTEDGGGILYPDGTDNNSISVKKGTGVNYTKESVSVCIVSFQLLYTFLLIQANLYPLPKKNDVSRY